LLHFSHKFETLWQKFHISDICQKLFTDIVSAECWVQGPHLTTPRQALTMILAYKNTVSQPNKYCQTSLMNSTVTGVACL